MNKRGVFRTVNIKNVPHFATTVGRRFVCTTKNLGTEKEAKKARYAAQDHYDKENPFMVHNTTTLKNALLR